MQLKSHKKKKGILYKIFVFNNIYSNIVLYVYLF